MGRKRTTQKSLRRGLIKEIYNATPAPSQSDYSASFNSGMSREEIASIYNSYKPEAQEIPKLENTTPTTPTPSISDELKRMEKAKADTTTPRTEGEQKAIDTYYNSLLEANRQSAPKSTSTPNYKAEIDRMNALKADNTAQRTEGENKAIDTYLNGLIEAQRYLDSQKPKTNKVTSTNVKKSTTPDKVTNKNVKNIGTVEIKADGTKNYTKTMSANEKRDYERALLAQSKARGRALSPNEQRDLERAQEAIAKAKEREKETTETKIIPAPTAAANNNTEELQFGQLSKQKVKATPTPNSIVNASLSALVNMGEEEVAKETAQEISNSYADRQQKEYEEALKEYNSKFRYDDRGFRITDSLVNEYIDPNKRLSGDEKKNAKKIVENYLANNPKANELFNTKNANYASKIRSEMSPEERDYYAKMITLENKLHGATSFAMGELNSVPFLSIGMDNLSNAMGVPEQTNFSNTVANARTQNPLLELGGEFLGKAEQYALINESPLGEIGGNGRLWNIARGQVADTALDTIPTLANNVALGKYTNEDGTFNYDEFGKDAVINQGTNLAANIGAEYINPFLLNKNSNALNPLEKGNVVKNASQMTDDLTIAKHQNALGVPGTKFNKLEQGDAVKALNNRGKITEILNKNPYINRYSNAPKKSEDLFEIELGNLRKQMNNYANWNMKENELFNCGSTPEILKEYGIKGNQIMMSQNIYDKITLPNKFRSDGHGLDRLGVEQIIRGLDDPAVIMNADDNDGISVVINYLDKKGDVVFVPLTLGKDGTITAVNDIDSASKIKSAHLRPRLDNYLGKRANQITYIKGDDKLLSDALAHNNSADILNLSSPLDSLSDLNVNQIDNAVKPSKVTTPDVNSGSGNNTIPRMEEPVNNPRKKVSQFATNTAKRGANFTPEEYAREVNLNDFTYEDSTEAESIGRAFNLVATEGKDNVAKRLTEEANRLQTHEIDALMSIVRVNNATARAMEAVGEDATDLRKQTNEILKRLRHESTDLGQGMQALAKWTRNSTPEGMLMNAENIISGNVEVKGGKLQETLKKLTKKYKDIDFSPEFETKFLAEAEKLQNIADINSREAKDIMANLGRMVNDELPVKLPEKVTAFLMDNMLGNVRTLLTRNAGGNVGLAGVEQLVERPLAALIDKGVAKKTNIRTQAGLSREGLKEYIQGFKKGLADEAHDIKTGLHTARTGENTLENAIRSNRHVFKNKLLDKRDSLIKNGLSVGDRPFYEATYKQTLGDYNRLREMGQMGEAIQNLSDEDFKTYAETAASLNALGAVYQNDSALSNGLMGIKQGLGSLSEGALGFDILSQFSMPFVKTPANVVDRAIDYSPFGFIRNAVRTSKEGGIGGKNFDQNRFVNETARNIIGTGLMAGAGAMAGSGAINGAYSDNANIKQAQKDSGMQEYGLNLPDWIPFVEPGTQMDIGWLPVVGSNAVAAAAAVDAFRNGEGNIVNNLSKGAGEGINTLFDQSMFQGLQRLFGTGDSFNSDEGLAGNVSNVVKSGLGQLFPSSLRQLAQVTDKYQRDTYGSNKDWELGVMKNNDINSLLNNLPIARENTMIPKVDLSGNPIMENQGRSLGKKIIEDMVLPGKITTTNENPLDQEAIRLSQITGNENAFRPKVSRSRADVGETPMSNEEWYQFEQDFGKTITATGNKIMESEFYQNADDETKEAMLKGAYDAVKSALYSEHNGKKPSGAGKAFLDASGYVEHGVKKKDIEAGIEAVADYIEAQNNPYGLDSDYYKKAVGESEDLSKYDGYKEALGENNVVDNKLYRNAYSEKGAEGLKDAVEYKATLDKLGLTDSEANKKAWDRGKEDALQNISNTKERASQAGFISKDGTPNTDAYTKAFGVLGSDESVSNYKRVADEISNKGYTKQDQYIPYLEEHYSNLSDNVRGQYALLLSGKPIGDQGQSAQDAFGEYGYEGYYYYKLLQLVPDLNDNGKRDKGDRIKQLYAWGFDKDSDDYKFYTQLKY